MENRNSYKSCVKIGKKILKKILGFSCTVKIQWFTNLFVLKMKKNY